MPVVRPKEEEGKKSNYIPYTEKMVEEQKTLAKKFGVITLVHGESDVEETLKILREMSKIFKKSK